MQTRIWNVSDHFSACWELDTDRVWEEATAATSVTYRQSVCFSNLQLCASFCSGRRESAVVLYFWHLLRRSTSFWSHKKQDQVLQIGTYKRVRGIEILCLSQIHNCLRNLFPIYQTAASIFKQTITTMSLVRPRNSADTNPEDQPAAKRLKVNLQFPWTWTKPVADAGRYIEWVKS